MLSKNPHEWIDQTTLAIFQHEHIWIHLIVHIVMIAMPVALIFLVLRWLILTIIWLKNKQPAKSSITNMKTAYQLPPGLPGFIARFSGRSQIGLALIAVSILPVTYAQL